ncbi:MAG TPA: ATP synthase F1 subunit gamma [Candidatus Deferrimicrobiaceae bacterium]|jgi:F-type H+-transporting ATPase subunit gamma
MANLRAIRKRISSVKSTQQITKAMKMVAAAKLRRSQDAITAARPYAQKLREVVESLAGKAGPEAHPLLAAREVKKLALLVITSDRGLCGGFNSALLRTVHRFLREHEGNYEQVCVFAVGRKGRDFFRRREVGITKEYVNVLGALSYFNAETMSHDLIDGFNAGQFDEVQIAFNEFRSAISQTPRFEKLFPISVDAGTGPVEGEADIDFIYEPGQNEILAKLLPKYVEMQIFRSLLESVAGEHGARMSAMDSATRNAKEMISSLTLQMNRARQATITKELSEIVSGAESLKG